MNTLKWPNGRSQGTGRWCIEQDAGDSEIGGKGNMGRTTTGRLRPDELAALWSQWSASGDRAVRDRLALALAPLVKHVVYRKVRELPAFCEAEDFVAVGMEALLGCLDRYEPGRGASLEQFVWTRVQGAVVDEMRRVDWATRTVRRWERELGRAGERFLGQEGRRANDDELGALLGLDGAEIRRRRTEIHRAEVHSLNVRVQSEDDSTVERIDALPSHDDSVDPLHAATVDAAKTRFREAFAALPDRDRRVAVLLYVEELPLVEIGKRLGVSESRVCQLHKALRVRLRAALEDDAALLASVA